MEQDIDREPFYRLLPVTVLVLFLLKNFWFKGAFPSLLSGKLSDFCACFFVPLFLAAIFREAGLLGGTAAWDYPAG